MVEQDKSLYFTNTTEYRLYAIIKNGIVCDGWFAKSKEEAQSDHPTALIVEVTLENAPFYIGDYYERNKLNA